ncbi:hypothetical protein C4D60_Mb06t20840 [Musa balbisiana]|uniref:HMA domain-containing protein n=1 Tax=Musa balbisiana TaxID=52838 RepID=A0A4S8IPH6_MUSBA|nr:hypothetical protein C4D60_Mb06t20840 [Musa balbisiana]
MQERFRSEAGEIFAACSDFYSAAGEISVAMLEKSARLDSCSNAVFEFGGQKSGGVFSERLQLAREQQLAVKTKVATVLPLGALSTEEVSIHKCCSRLQRMAMAEGRRRRRKRDGRAVMAETQGEAVDSGREAIVGLWQEKEKKPEEGKKEAAEAKEKPKAKDKETEAKTDERKDRGGGREEEKNEGGDEEKKAETPEPPPRKEIEMRVFMHCEGCARKVKRSLKGFEGEEDVATDCRTHKVVAKGKKAAIEIPGVLSAEADLKASQVTVKGAFLVEKLVEYVYKRTGKHAVVAKQDPVKKAGEEKKTDVAAVGGDAAKEEKKADEAGGANAED